MKKRMTIMIIALVVVFGGIVAFNIVRSKMMAKIFASFPMPPATISATKAKAVTWQPYLTSVGNFIAVAGVYVTPQVAGMIDKIYYKAGQMVAKGAPLIKLDDRVDVQELNNLLAQLKLDKLSFDRESILYKTKATSKSTLDAARAKLSQTEALVAKAKVLIDQKTIKASFAGKVGIGTIDLGQYVQPGEKLFGLQAINPIYVRFNLPEQDFTLLHDGQKVLVTVDAYKGKQFEGTINATDSEVNSQTRNILVQALVKNPNNELYPGMFANVKIVLPVQKNVIVVPQTAVTYTLYGDTVFVVEQGAHSKEAAEKAKKFKIPYSDLKVVRKAVVVGERRGDRVVIVKGLKAGEEVVTSGQLKLQDGMSVIVDKKVDMGQEQTHETLH